MLNGVLDFGAASVASAPAPANADGSMLDVLLLQVHLTGAIAWLAVCAVVAVVAVPHLRSMISPGTALCLTEKRALLVILVWCMFSLTLASGTYLLFQHAVYDAPLSGPDFDALAEAPYAEPYFYALYGKIGLFLAMGAASLVLGAAVRTGEASAARGRHVPLEIGLDAPRGGSAVREVVCVAPARRQVSQAGLWAAVGVLVLGALGSGFCVTLIKYFHELALAAVPYDQLRSR